MADLKELLKFGRGNSNIKIAVLDGSVDLEHPCFNTAEGNLVAYDDAQIQPSATKGLALKHGTAVCSLIFGKPNSIVEGVAPGCSGLIIPIYTEDDNGVFSSASQVELARAIEIAIQKGANIINISGGQFSNTGHPDVFLKQAIDKCFKAGILIVAAAGNDGCNCLHVPAADEQVLAIGAERWRTGVVRELGPGGSTAVRWTRSPAGGEGCGTGRPRRGTPRGSYASKDTISKAVGTGRGQRGTRKASAPGTRSLSTTGRIGSSPAGGRTVR